jgi:cell division protein FtsZ
LQSGFYFIGLTGLGYTPTIVNRKDNPGGFAYINNCGGKALAFMSTRKRTVNATEPEEFVGEDVFARIKVVGVGGSGCHAINRMINSRIKGVEFVAINTDAQDLYHCDAPVRVQIGQTATRGLGAGSDSELGRKSAEEDKEAIYQALKDADMVFVTCGMGGGTGTGAAPIVCEIARELGALTIAVVTKPFSFEGLRRKRVAEEGLIELQPRVDTLITIPNDRLLQVIDKKTSLYDAFSVVDDILRQGVQGIADLITMHGMINVDFADVKAIMRNAGSALMGIGRGTGESRALEAAKMAIDSPLLELSIDGAKGILFNITGGPDMAMYEIDEAARVITEAADPEANVIFGAVVDEAMQGEIKITVIATGFDDSYGQARKAESRPMVRPMEDREEEKEELDVPAFIRKKISH